MADTSHALEPIGLAHHFQDLRQQREAAELGMWLFLVTEFMFFGGLFLAYFIYRSWYPDDFGAGGHTMSIPLGTINTAVLLTSSLTMALGVAAASHGRQQALAGLLGATIALGVVFLAIKGFEYHHKYEENLIPFAGLAVSEELQSRPGMIAFINLYFLMTGLHAFHMIIGIGILLVLMALAWRGRLPPERSILVHNVGLYWHFVDLIWVYLFPFFYLVSAHPGGTPAG